MQSSPEFRWSMGTSIRRKLMRIVMLASGVALLLATIAFGAVDLVSFGAQMTQNLETLAQITGSDSTAALTFNDPKAAQEILSSLSVKTHILRAGIYGPDGKLFAEYRRHDVPASGVPPAPGPEGYRLTMDRLIVFHRIVLDDQRIGTVYIESDLRELTSRPARYAGIVVMVLLASLLVGFLLSAGLRGAVTDPILHLAQTALVVSLRKDYSIRATKRSQDELGFLVDRFNDMLGQIQARDQELQRHREHLEEEVAGRTAELVDANAQLATAKEKAEEARARTELLLNSTAEAIYGIDLNGNCTLSNPACRRMLGYDDPRDLLGRNMHELVHYARPDGTSYPNHDCRIYQSFRQGQGTHVDDEVLWRADGTSFPVEYWSYPIWRGGEVMGAVVTFVDITERKRAEAALRESNETLTALFETAPVAITTIDPAANVVMWNPAAERIFGWSEEGVKGRLLPYVPAEKEPEFRALLARVLSGESLTGLEVVRRKKDGSPIHLNVSAAPLRDADGKIRGSMSIAADITERKQAEEKFRGLLESAPEAMVIVNQGGCIVLVNQQSEKLFGYAREELLGASVEILLPERFRKAHVQHRGSYSSQLFRRAMGAGLPLFGQRKDGTEFALEVSLSPLKTAEGMLVISAIRDITERKRAEEELQKVKEAAEAASRAKSEFLANMSHEIRTPLNGILGMVDLTLGTSLSREQRDFLTLAKDSADSLLTVINGILDFSKIEAGKMDLDRIDFRLRDALGDAIKPLALRADQRGLELICHIRPDVPEVLAGDPGRLRQVVLNLVGNAIKFTERGEVVLRVEAEAQASGEICLHFSVSDTGVGIPPEKKKLIFEAFEQADSSTNRKYGGTGLGLTISTRLVELMGGRIWVESESGKGSTFHFTARFGLPEGETTQKIPAEPAALEDLPVLVVDDNATNRRVLEEMVRNWRMRPATASSGEAGLTAMEQARSHGVIFPLVLLDANMPGMDGFAVAERIKKTPELAGASILMLSSAGKPGDAARCRELGITVYLTKPIKQSELLDAILAALGRPEASGKQPQLVTKHSLRENRRRLRILLAEDNQVNQRLTVHLLEERGHRVALAQNGKEALTALERENFDLVLMDVQMPEMDGLEATAAIRAKEKPTGGHLPIIALTAHAMKGDRERCLAAGMDGYISKPIRSRELNAEIDRLLSRNNRKSHPESHEPAAERNAEQVFHEAAALARVEGDRALLAEMAALFLEDCPKLLSAVRDALDLGDAQALERAAHTLKGSLGNFAAAPAVAAALELEQLGRNGDLPGAADAYLALDKEIERLKSAMAALGPEVTR